MEGTTPVARKAGMTSPLRQADGSDRSAEEIAYPVLYRRLLPRTLRWLGQFGVAERHREDVAQEVWIRVLRTLEHYESDRPFEPWLMTITFRAACDHLKRADVRRERLSEAGEVEPPATPATEDLVIDAVHTLETLLQRLTPDHRTDMVDGEELPRLARRSAFAEHRHGSPRRSSSSALRCAPRSTLGRSLRVPVTAALSTGREVPIVGTSRLGARLPDGPRGTPPTPHRPTARPSLLGSGAVVVAGRVAATA